MHETILETADLTVRKATTDDTGMFYELWNNPDVMKWVGFPEGLGITREAIRIQIEGYDESEYNRLLVVCLKDDGSPIGECKLGRPNDDGISETDIKLLPRYWGKGFGTQIKRALVDYLFTHTDCRIVKATPNKLNLASIKMQEAVGGVRVGEGLYKFPVTMKLKTCDVPYYEYHIRREAWIEPELP